MEAGSVKLNNAAECYGYILSFLAYWSDGKWHDAESDVMMTAVAATMKACEIDTDGDGDSDFDDFSASMDSIGDSFANCTFDEACVHVKGICQDYFGKWNDKNRQIILDTCVKLVKADGELTDQESSNVNVIAGWLSLDKPL